MNNNKPIALIGAMDCEIQKVVELLDEVKIMDKPFKVYEGKLFDKNVIVVKSGVGKSAAAMTTQYITDKYEPKCIINSGIAGCINPELGIYDVVLGAKLIQHDFDATALGYSKGYMCTGIEPTKPTVFYSDKDLLNSFLNNADKILYDKKVIAGAITTGDMFISSFSKKQELRKVFGADAAEMEAAAIAQVANYNCIPCLVVRTIADLSDENAAETNKATETELAEYSANIILKFLEVI